MLFFVLFSLILVSSTFAQQCNDPKITDIKTFSTKDTNLNSQTTYVVEFRAQCAGNTKNVPFFTEINGRYLTSSTDESGERYQITWTESNNLARSEEISVRIYDEETFGALKKAQRANADTSKIKELKTVTFYHTGSYKGPSIQVELLITVVFGAIFYWAFTQKNRLLA